ncbi:MAG: Uma2 family endonuclease [Flavisolibacter sp.]|nr:Uma2 family endonuclease [Flavisolibacter sp.]
MEVLTQTPPRTLMEVYKMLPEGTRAELIDNVLYMPPSPTSNHQSASMDLGSSIHLFLKRNNLGTVFSAPMDVYLDETSNAVQPDIIVVLKDQMNIIHDKGHIHGVPAILIEILSEGNKNHDLIRKKDLYERFGVQEYHIVDPDTKLVLSFFLSEGKYGAAREEIGRLYSPLLQEGFEF